MVDTEESAVYKRADKEGVKCAVLEVPRESRLVVARKGIYVRGSVNAKHFTGKVCYEVSGEEAEKGEEYN